MLIYVASSDSWHFVLVVTKPGLVSRNDMDFIESGQLLEHVLKIYSSLITYYRSMNA